MCKWQPNCEKVLVLSFGFFLLFTAGNTAANLLSQIMRDNNYGNLGFYSMGTMYLCFGMSSFFSAPVLACLGDKYSIAFGSLAHVIQTGVQILPLE
jgi:hypothetical protein